MARILKARVQPCVDDAAPGIAETSFGALYSLEKHVSVRSVARALAEELGKVVGAHAGDRCKLREAEVLRQVVGDMIENPF
jgi:hypothetical protein